MARDITRVKPNIDEDNAEETTESRPGRVTKDVTGSIQPGWSVDHRPAYKSADRPTRFTVGDDEEVLMKFIEPLPFAPIYQHWIATKEGRRAYVCLGTGCPMCDRGDRAKSSDWFNVAVLPKEGGEPTLQVWYATADPAKAIKDKAEKPRYSPLNKPGLYFAVSKTQGKNGFNTYTIDPVKEEELEEWAVQPLTQSQIEQFEKDAYTAEIVKQHTKTELLEIARQYLED
jgi:hypothetical protein